MHAFKQQMTLKCMNGSVVQLSLVFLGIEFIQKANQTQGFEQKAQNEITITFCTTSEIET